MSGIWVDTDFGFDDLWALLLLRHLGCAVDGVSLVAGNAPLDQVVANALGARVAYGLEQPMWRGEAQPLVRHPETAERILSVKGMRTRGLSLPIVAEDTLPVQAIAALAQWLEQPGPREVLAIGPLTNIARLIERHRDAACRITRLVWMGGSAGPGNHTPMAEFNAVADAEALETVLSMDLPLDIVDLTFCRQVVYTGADMPATDPLTQDLLGGYLDIALERGRTGMAIYDPLAALAIAAPDRISFAPCHVSVSTRADETYGATRIDPGPEGAGARTRLATAPTADLARICLQALEGEVLMAHGV
ncbi:nucleoside hydrolase [Primorskyibacter sp. S187A]|uniref:nucleoside hydrolase n=1 Tax=Primorskyibacter sp. S187A TaxID=3415130 RepID=UPI003C7A6ABA